jgi:hypothetical protein
MRHSCILLGVLALCVGCTSVSDRAQWEEAMRDLRGENMQMGGKSSAMDKMNDKSLRKEWEN